MAIKTSGPTGKKSGHLAARHSARSSGHVGLALGMPLWRKLTNPRGMPKNPFWGRFEQGTRVNSNQHPVPFRIARNPKKKRRRLLMTNKVSQ